jgi:hypothetical protein
MSRPTAARTGTAEQLSSFWFLPDRWVSGAALAGSEGLLNYMSQGTNMHGLIGLRQNIGKKFRKL